MTETRDDKGFARYVRTIENMFIFLRGTPFVLSPADISLALEWYESGVPLEMVKESLHEVTEAVRRRTPEKKINSLSYFRWSVAERYFRMRANLEAGAASISPSGEEMLSRMAALWSEYLRELEPDHEITTCVEAFVSALREHLASGKTPASAGKQIPGLRDRLFDCLWEYMKRDNREKIIESVNVRIKEQENLLPAGTRETLKMCLLRKEIEKLYGLPPLPV